MHQLAQMMGVETEYVDGRNIHQQVPPESLRQILSDLGCDLQDEIALRDSMLRLQQEAWTEILEPVILYFPEEKRPLAIPVSLPVEVSDLDELLLKIQLRNEFGKIRNFRVKGSECSICDDTKIRSIPYVRGIVTLSRTLSFGYFTLQLEGNSKGKEFKGQSLVISAPKRCYAPSTKKRLWGLSIQLYSLRSKQNWGIGDFRDLAKVINTTGKSWKAGTIGLSPLHALTPGVSSPYSPSSRLFWNLLYLNLEEISEFRGSSEILNRFRSKKFQDRLKKLRDEPLVNYPQISSLKVAWLKRLFAVFSRNHLRKNTRRARNFLKFVQFHDPALSRFCAFQALSEQFGSTDWKRWPVEYRNPDSPAVVKFQQHDRRRMQFFQYVQWQCELQLQRLDRVARNSLLALRLYQDLPVGIHPDGADAWVYQDQLVPHATVGAPPDTFNLQGQNWGLQTFSPRALRRHGYQFLRDTFTRNMRYGGVLRIDHALGLFRKFYIPQGGTGQDGVYVRMHVDEVLAILSLESHRHRVMIVGEDLGTVTPAIREKLQTAGLLSYRLLLFQRGSDGSYEKPHAYPTQALVAATTHDLPTLPGFWVGRDIEVKEGAGLYPTQEAIDQDWEGRAEDRLRLWEALNQEGLCGGTSLPLSFSPEAIESVCRFLARSPSRLLILQLEDVLVQLETSNLPGASEDAYPSWRVKGARELEDWLKDPLLKQLAQQVVAERRFAGGGQRTHHKAPQNLCML